MNKAMKKLDFIGIGAQKAATTWLFRCLEEHLDIRGALTENNKELNFFNHNYEKGYTWYHSQFEFGSWKTGEYSVLYFYDKNVPERIYKYNPNVKLLLSLRNPIERAFSHHLLQIKHNQIPKHLYCFSEAVKHNPTYIEMGKYATQLEYYLEFFDSNQIHVMLFDDIKTKPELVLQELFKFIGVNEKFRPSLLNKKIYVTHAYRSRALDKFINTTSKVIGKFLGDPIVAAVKATKLPSFIRSYNEVKFDKRIVPPLSKDECKYLYDVFADEIERLSILINRDLSNWKFADR